MIHNLVFLLLFIFSIIYLPLKGQNVEKEFKADSVFIYKNFKEWGTTARLRYNHRILDSTKAIKSKISNHDLIELMTIVNNTKRKNLFQQKYGGETVYLIIYNDGHKKKYVAGAGTKSYILDDLDDMKRWIIKDTIEVDKISKIFAPAGVPTY